MKNTKSTYALLTGLVVISLFCLYIIYNSYSKNKTNSIQKIETIFESTISKDKDRRQSEVNFSYHRIKEPEQNQDSIRIESEKEHITIKKEDSFDLLSEEEIMYIHSQMYLSQRNPIQIAILDSLFHEALIQQKIPALTAVTYTLNGKTEYSHADSSSYTSNHALKEIVIGPNRKIVLQAYIQIPVSYLIKQSLPLYILIILVWIGIVALFIWREFFKKPKGITIVPIPEVTKRVIEITKDLSFDEEHGLLIYKDTTVSLKNKALSIFNLLLKNRGYYIASEDILQTCWPDGSVTKDALTTTIKRLKQDMEPIPELTIESARSKGYKLIISDTPTQSETNSTAV